MILLTGLGVAVTIVSWLAGGLLALASGSVSIAGLLALIGPVAIVAGHIDRRIERARFSANLTANRFRDHQEYINSTLWKHRRRRYLAEVGRLPCCVCARPWVDGPQFHLHHVDYAQAGGGREPNRDLKPICDRCHTIVHQFDRRKFRLRIPRFLCRIWIFRLLRDVRIPLGLKPLGVSLRRTTGLVQGIVFPWRLLRRGVRLAFSGAR